ncbi:hypothetical protein D3C72_2594040 [compost metagenome]
MDTILHRLTSTRHDAEDLTDHVHTLLLEIEYFVKLPHVVGSTIVHRGHELPPLIE